MLGKYLRGMDILWCNLALSMTGEYYFISEQRKSREPFVVFNQGIGVKSQIMIKMGKVYIMEVSSCVKITANRWLVLTRQIGVNYDLDAELLPC